MNRWINKHLFYNGALLLRREWIYTHLKVLQHSQWETEASLKEYQEKRLSSICRIARENSPYYRKRLPNRISLNSLDKIPCLDKDMLRKNISALRATISRFDRVKTTGGSTGAPVVLYKNSQAMAEELAATWRGYQWAGVNIGDRQGRFWGVPASQKGRLQAQAIDFICNRIRISAFARTTQEWQLAYDSLKRFRPDYFYGYMSVIKEFAEFLEDSGNHVKPRTIITTSEALTKPDRCYIQDAFSTSVFNEYGCGEVGTIAHECNHRRLHINAENLIVEILDEDGITLPVGHEGEIVVTDLSNTAMPLIRYRMADWGALSDEQCPCGRTLPVLKHVYGRAYDSLVNPLGEKFHGEFFLYIIEDANKQGLFLDGVQFVQGKSGDITVCLVCKDDVFNPLQQFILQRLLRDFDAQAIVHFEKVRKILRESSGKLRVVKQES